MRVREVTRDAVRAEVAPLRDLAIHEAVRRERQQLDLAFTAIDLTHTEGDLCSWVG